MSIASKWKNFAVRCLMYVAIGYLIYRLGINFPFFHDRVRYVFILAWIDVIYTHYDENKSK